MSEEDKPEESSSAEGEEGGGRSFSPLKIILFVGLPVLLILGGIGGAYFMGFFDSLFGHKTEEAAAAHGEAHPTSTSAFIDIPRLTVNLATTGNQRALLQIALSLEIKDAAMAPAITAELPRVLDAVQVFLRELRVEDLAGTRGTMRIKEELLTRVNAAIAPEKVDDVLFKEMLVQ